MTDSARLIAALADRYRIEREIGAGGMARVFLAFDMRHERKVALKVLRDELAAAVGAERFLHEIKTTANLQHPHILALFDSGQVDDCVYYAMPFIDGETLRDRLMREKQLPIADALQIAVEVAQALDYAHRRGVIHRDIKPENILLSDGHAIVADFGIALAASRRERGERITETGFALGTPQYMSPEQATGERELSGRSDVYALGTVLYEMLTGAPPFTAPTTPAIFNLIVTATPLPLRSVRHTVPVHVERAVQTALQRLPADRYGSAAEFARALESPMVDPPAQATVAAPLEIPRAPQRGGRGLPALALAAIVTAGLALWWWLAREPARGQPARLEVSFPAGRLLRVGLVPFDISRDGTEIVYAAEQDGQARLYLRPVSDFNALALPGTEDAELPFFSHDGQWIGYFTQRKLWKVARTGGAPIELTQLDSDVPTGASWGADGSIWWGVGASLHRVSGADGSASDIAIRTDVGPGTPDAGPGAAADARYLRWPQVLPDGVHALGQFSERDRGDGSVWIGVLDLRTGRARLLLRGRQPRYLSSGHLLFEDDEGRLRVAAFDLNTFTVIGAPQPSIEVFRGSGSTGAQFAVSDTGTLVYVPGGFERTLVFVDRNGRETDPGFGPRGYRFPRVAPDGNAIAVTVDPRPSDIWIRPETRDSRVVRARSRTKHGTVELSARNTGQSSCPFQAIEDETESRDAAMRAAEILEAAQLKPANMAGPAGNRLKGKRGTVELSVPDRSAKRGTEAREETRDRETREGNAGQSSCPCPIADETRDSRVVRSRRSKMRLSHEMQQCEQLKSWRRPS